jgi:hypothetical protein
VVRLAARASSTKPFPFLPLILTPLYPLHCILLLSHIFSKSFPLVLDETRAWRILYLPTCITKERTLNPFGWDGWLDAALFPVLFSISATSWRLWCVCGTYDPASFFVIVCFFCWAFFQSRWNRIILSYFLPLLPSFYHCNVFSFSLFFLLLSWNGRDGQR